MGQLGCDMWHPVLRRCGNWIPSPSLREFVPFATFKKDTSNEAWVWVVHFGRWFKKSEKSFSKSFPWISVIFFFVFFCSPQDSCGKKNTFTNKQKIVAALSCGNDHISRSSSQLPLSGIMWSLCWRLMPQWIRDNPINLRSPSVQDLQWSLCRPPIKALKFQIEVGCSYEVPSLWDPFGLLARPEGRQKGDFFHKKKQNPFLFFKGFCSRKKRHQICSKLFQFHAFKWVFSKTCLRPPPKPPGFYDSFSNLKKNSNLQWVVFLRETRA